jgi:hypothetical protein
MKRVVMLLVLVLCIVFTGAVFAQDEGAAEDPKENACYTGGDLEGKCDWPTDAEDEWAWECGYYYAGFMSGKFNETPEWCDILFAEVEEGVAPVNLCITVDSGAGRDALLFHEVKVTGYANQPGNSTLYSFYTRVVADPCDDDFAMTGIESQWMQTPGYIEYEDALVMCEAALGTEFVDAFQIEHKDLPAFNFVCHELLK